MAVVHDCYNESNNAEPQSAIGKGITTSPKPIDLSGYPDGDYSIEYLDPDGAKHALGKVTLQRKKNGEGGGRQPATRPESK